MRAFAYVMAADMDRAHRDPDAGERARRQTRVDLLIPVLKAWCTELGVEIASTGVQVHGGMGYIEETGACQFLRDARIAPIYEGTTGIQAADLAGRKLASDQGAAMAELVAEMRQVATGACRAARIRKWRPLARRSRPVSRRSTMPPPGCCTHWQLSPMRRLPVPSTI